MTQPRFILPDLEPSGTRATLPQAQATHVRAVRLRVGDPLILSDGRGTQRSARLLMCTRDRVEVEFLEEELEARDSPFQLTLCVAALKGDKLDWVVEKATELGVSRIVSVQTENSLGAGGANKLERWRRLAIAAAEQSQRSTVPSIEGTLPLTEVLAHGDRPQLSLILSESPSEQCLARQLPTTAHQAWTLVGPEGGFTPAELDFAAAHGWQRTRFGPRILRAETAAIAIVTALQMQFGDLAQSA